MSSFCKSLWIKAAAKCNVMECIVIKAAAKCTGMEYNGMGGPPLDQTNFAMTVQNCTFRGTKACHTGSTLKGT